MSTTHAADSAADLTPEEKGNIAEKGLEKLFESLRVWHVPLDATVDQGALLARGPEGEKIRCPDYYTFTPRNGLHEAKYRLYSRSWSVDDSAEDDERIYVGKDRWEDYCQHAEWNPVFLWVYIESESTWIKQSVSNLSPVDDGVIKVKNEHGNKEDQEVYWFSVLDFEEFSIGLC